MLEHKGSLEGNVEGNEFTALDLSESLEIYLVLYFNWGNVIFQMSMCCSPWKKKIPIVQIN